MARTPEPDSATSQFFINLTDNSQTLDYQPGQWGYTVFGEVSQGINLLYLIENLPTNTNDVPLVDVIIKKAERVNPSNNTATPAGSTP